MLISTKGQYALEAVLDLALKPEGSCESLKDLAQRREISESYLEQIFIKLRRHGIVKSVRGINGGYRLARNPAQITAGQVIRALEGPFKPVLCLTKTKKQCARYPQCITRRVWERIESELDSVADSITLKMLADKFNELYSGKILNYQI
ncbi:MAG TPA: Rrf2 family transcriptional regulator [Clostridia bacterium]|nr:Rrf2 family transcriptional regulator [Clostridia bacterium]